MRYSRDWIFDTLSNLGYRLENVSTEQWRTQALFRGGQNSKSLVIWKESGVWCDFGDSSGQYYPFNLLVERSVGPSKAREILGAAKTITEPSEAHGSTLLTMPKVYDPSCLKRLLPHHLFYTKRGISAETLKKLNSGYSTSGTMTQRYVFPLYNEAGQIISFGGRHVFWKEGDAAPKWKFVSQKSLSVFPLYTPNLKECEEQIIEKQSVILVESIGDCLALMEKGHFNILCLFGLAISDKMVAELIRLNPERIIVATNKDEKGNGQIAAAKTVLKLSNFFSPEKLSIKMPTRNDIHNMLIFGDDIDAWLAAEEKDLYKFLYSYSGSFSKKDKNNLAKFHE